MPVWICVSTSRSTSVADRLPRPQPSRLSGRLNLQIESGEEGDINSRVFVGNLSYETTQGELETLFSQVGQVVEVFLPADRNTGRPRGFAFVELADGSAAAEAIEKFDGHELNGRNLRVTEAEARPPRPARMPDAERQPPWGQHGPKGGKPKGSRRNVRGRKRSL